MKSKFIAREFLILVGIIPCLVLSYFYYDTKRKNIEKDIISNQNTYDSVMSVFGPHNREYYRRLSDREPFYVKVFNYRDNPEYPSYSYDISIWKYLEKLYRKNELDYSNYTNFPSDIKAHLKLIGINSIEELKESVDYVYISPEYHKKNEELKTQRDKLTSKISFLKKNKINDTRILNYLKSISIWYISIIFIFRYFILALIWSIRTLKTKEKPST
ncbi:MAG: hypothetical protein K9G42_11080 [Pedobacter sp.]|nr:hypothetical protein [Pedobacter sp.]